MAVQLFKQIFVSFPQSKPNRQFLSSYYFFSTSSSPSDQPDPASIATVVSVLTHHRSKSRWNYLLSLCPSGFTPTQFSRIALSLRNNPYLVHRFFFFTQRKSLCKHNLTSYATVIHLLSRGRLTSQAQDLIRVAIRLPGENQDRLGRKQELKLFEVLVKTYRECGSAPFVFDLLITSCLESKRIDGALDIVRTLMSRGKTIGLKVSTCNALIWAVSRSRGVTSGYKIYREVFGLDGEKIEAKGVVTVRPNVHTFNALMSCFYREGLFERVDDTWIEMESLGCEPNCSSYSVLMAVLCEEGRMSEAEKLWEEMRDKNIEHDVVAYNTIIGGFCRLGEIGRAEEFFREMWLNGVEISCNTSEHLVNGYCRVGDIDSAILVFKEMTRKHFRPERSTIEALIGVLCDKRRVSEAMEILRVGVENFGLSPTKNSYKLLINGFCEDGKMEEALKVQAEMVGKGFDPSLEIYNAFIDGYVEQGNEEMAKILRNEMLETQERKKES